MIILIPAYEPDQQLPALIRSIRDAEPWATVVVVDDGSGPAYREVFDGVRPLGCHVIGYARNRGKGFALKTGFGFIADHLPGPERGLRRQRRPAHRRGHPSRGGRAYSVPRHSVGASAMVLGTRSFTGNVPARSRFGNTATRLLFTAGHRRAHRRHPDRPARLPGRHAPLAPVRPRRALRVRAEPAARGQAGRLRDRQRGHRHGLPGPQRGVALPAARGLGPDLCPAAEVPGVLVHGVPCRHRDVPAPQRGHRLAAACGGRRPGRELGRQLRRQPQAGVPARPGEACGRKPASATSAWCSCCLPPTSRSSRPLDAVSVPPLAGQDPR